jgi:hypothetical protein
VLRALPLTGGWNGISGRFEPPAFAWTFLCRAGICHHPGR